MIRNDSEEIKQKRLSHVVWQTRLKNLNKNVIYFLNSIINGVILSYKLYMGLNVQFFFFLSNFVA